MSVTVVLSGLPQFVALQDLFLNLDKIFDTDEIGIFSVRELSKIHRSKWQIALDFTSGYDAMYAQSLLDGKKYTLPAGEVKVLRAKVTSDPVLIVGRRSIPVKTVERARARRHYGSSSEDEFPDTRMSRDEIRRKCDRMDAELELLRKRYEILDAKDKLRMKRAKLKESKEERQLKKLLKKKHKPKKISKRKQSETNYSKSRTSRDKSVSPDGVSKPKRLKCSEKRSSSSCSSDGTESSHRTLRGSSNDSYASCSKNEGTSKENVLYIGSNDLRLSIQSKNLSKRLSIEKKRHTSESSRESRERDRRHDTRSPAENPPQLIDRRRSSASPPRLLTCVRSKNRQSSSQERDSSADSKSRSRDRDRSLDRKSISRDHKRTTDRKSRSKDLKLPTSRTSRSRDRNRSTDRISRSRDCNRSTDRISTSRDRNRSTDRTSRSRDRNRRTDRTSRSRNRHRTKDRESTDYYRFRETSRSPEHRSHKLGSTSSSNSRTFLMSHRHRSKRIDSWKEYYENKYSKSSNLELRKDRNNSELEHDTTRFKAIEYNPNVHDSYAKEVHNKQKALEWNKESIIVDMNTKYKREEAIIEKKEKAMVIFENNRKEAIKHIMLGKYNLINQLCVQHDVTKQEKKKILSDYFKAVNSRMKNSGVCDMSVDSFVATYLHMYSEIVDDDLVSKLICDIVDSRNEGVGGSTSTADQICGIIDDVWDEFEIDTLTKDVNPNVELDEDDDPVSSINLIINIQSSVAKIRHSEDMEHYENINEVDNKEVQEIDDEVSVKVEFDEEIDEMDPSHAIKKELESEMVSVKKEVNGTSSSHKKNAVKAEITTVKNNVAMKKEPSGSGIKSENNKATEPVFENKQVNNQVKTEIDDDDVMFVETTYPVIKNVKSETTASADQKPATKDDDVMVVESKPDVINLSDTEEISDDEAQETKDDIKQNDIKPKKVFNISDDDVLDINVSSDCDLDNSDVKKEQNETTASKARVKFEAKKMDTTPGQDVKTDPGRNNIDDDVICLSDSIEISDDETSDEEPETISDVDKSNTEADNTCEQIDDDYDKASVETMVLDTQDISFDVDDVDTSEQQISVEQMSANMLGSVKLKEEKVELESPIEPAIKLIKQETIIQSTKTTQIESPKRKEEMSQFIKPADIKLEPSNPENNTLGSKPEAMNTIKKEVEETVESIKSEEIMVEQTKTVKKSAELTKSIENSTELIKSVENSTEVTDSVENSTELTKSEVNSTEVINSVENSTALITSVENSTEVTKSLQNSSELTNSVKKSPELTKSVENSSELTKLVEKKIEEVGLSAAVINIASIYCAERNTDINNEEIESVESIQNYMKSLL